LARSATQQQMRNTVPVEEMVGFGGVNEVGRADENTYSWVSCSWTMYAILAQQTGASHENCNLVRRKTGRKLTQEEIH